VADRQFTIAIDGPAAAGKSTVGEQVATTLDGVYFDTGVLYRAVTLSALRAGVASDDAARLAEIAASMQVAIGRPSVADGRQSDVLLDGQDVTWELRTPAVDRSVSAVSAHPAVRAALLGAQRRIGRSGRVVMVGRDIGTVVLPDAELKIFLDASPEERARRRCAQLEAAGKPADYASILADIVRRDDIDTQRAASPLRPADDALIVDSDGRSIPEVVDLIVAAARARLGCAA
jgi:cytidylate kinase